MIIHVYRHGHGSSMDTFGAIHIHIRAISVSMHGYTDLSTDIHPPPSDIQNTQFLHVFEEFLILCAWNTV
jgi:hypothetical protein